MKTIIKVILGVFAVSIVVLFANMPESGYKTASAITTQGDKITLYKITSDEYYLRPKSNLYEEIQLYGEIRYKPAGKYITTIDLTGRYRLSNGRASFNYNNKYWTSTKPIKIDKAIAEAEILEKELEDEYLEITFFTEDGETVNCRYSILDPEKYIIPYGAEVFTSMGREGTVKGINPGYGGFAGMGSVPAYFTTYTNMGIFQISVYEICQKPIEGSISDVVHNPEKYGYPNETICSRRDLLGR